MNRQSLNRTIRYSWLFFALACWPVVGNSQVAVAEIEEFEELPVASAEELETLIGPIALYPDDLLAIVLPASTFPLQIVEAGRFLEELENDSSLKPDEDWDDSVVALLNYPEVIELLNEDLDWTWRLGEAVVAQQEDIISAIELFRDRAYAAGNLKSDDYQLVAHEGSAIQITPVEEDVIYVPYYEPEQVVVYQQRPVYYYYPRPYPVYYYPYPAYHSFHSSFWGVTTAFAIGWHSHHLNVYHHSFYGHPYYGHSYWDRYWYRRPDIHVYNNVHVRDSVNVSYNRYRDGDPWRPNLRRTVRSSDQRVTRTRYYPSSSSRSNTPSAQDTSSFAGTASASRVNRYSNSQRQRNHELGRDDRPEIQFRDRPATSGTSASNRSPARSTAVREARQRQPQVKEPQTRQPQLRQQQVRQSQARVSQPSRPQAQPKQSQVRRSEPKQSQARRSEPKQSQARRSEPKQSQARQSQARRSAPKQSQARATPQRQPKAKQSEPRKSQRVARNSTSQRSSRER